MPFAIRNSLRAIESHLLAGGYLTAGVQIGEPKAPPTAPLVAAIIMGDVAVVAVTAGGGTIERHTILVRIYENMLAEPEEAIELDMANVVSRVMASLIGEYDLGATIRNIDVGGQHGDALRATWGYLDVGGRMFRIADIHVGLIVDDSVMAAA